MCEREGSPRPRRRMISVSVSALRISCSSAGRIAGEGETGMGAGAEIAAIEPAPRGLPFVHSRKIASIRSCTVSASATTRSGKRTPQASPRRSINSTRSRLPSPSSRSRWAAGPRAASSSSPREPPSSTRSWRTVASACAPTTARLSSFVPVAPIACEPADGQIPLSFHQVVQRAGFAPMRMWCRGREYHLPRAGSMAAKSQRSSSRYEGTGTN